MIGTASALQMGCALGVATILSVGPTNLTVMREGLTRGRIWLVVAVFSTVNLALMLPAYFVADVLKQLDPTVRNALSWLAVAVLLYFAFRSFRAASSYKPSTDGTAPRETRLACTARVLSIVLVNPLAYLELFFLPAAIFQTLAEPGAGIEFMAAALTVSFLGLCAYGFGGRIIGNLVSRNGALRVFDRASGAILSGVAVMLALTLVGAE